jgi:hypothetical protein
MIRIFSAENQPGRPRTPEFCVFPRLLAASPDVRHPQLLLGWHRFQRIACPAES